MTNPEHLSQLIGDIYDASLDPGLWVGVLEKVAGFVGGPATALLSTDTASRSGGFYYSWGDDAHYTKLYFEKYIRLNPLIVPMALLDVGDVQSIMTLMPADEFRKTRVYKEWAKPQEYGDATLGVIEKSATVMTQVVTTHRDCDSPVSDEARRRMGLILPHLRRAVAIGRIVELHKVEAASLGDAVDAISAGVFLVTEGAVIVWTNASGRRMLDARLILHADRGRLAPMDKASAGQFHQAIEAAGAGHMVVGSRRPAVPLGGSEQEEPYVAHVLPLTSGRRRQAGVRYAATAAVFVHKAAMTGLTPIEAIAQHFQLTPAEVRVLIAIVDVGGVQEVAAVLGISEATVKTHLQRVFAKTETHRQADLVKIVAGFANPLIS